MPSRIFLKLLMSFLLSFTVLVVIIFFIINSAFQQGFINYLQQKEKKLVEEMLPYLISHYQTEKSWQSFYQNRRLWSQTLRLANIPMPPRGPRPASLDPPERAVSSIDRIAHPPPTFAMRISLYDIDNNLIFGAENGPGKGQWIAIYSELGMIGRLHLRSLELKDDQLANSFVEQQQQKFIYIALVVLLLAIFLAAVGAGFLLRPVNRVISGVKRLASGEYSARVRVVGSDELAQLADQFNSMAHALECNENLRAQWLADISHELRTPLTVIRGELEALLDGLREPTMSRIRSVFDETNALTSLVDDLHLLSMADNGALKLALKPVLLVKLVEHQVGLFTLRMEQKGLLLSFVNELNIDDLTFADEQRIGQVICNLLENSLRYTDQGGSVKVALDRDGAGRLRLKISDSKPSVKDVELEKIFDRLYCADKSRSRSVGGSGLGLAICKSIIHTHKGEIAASQAREGGLCITLCLHSTKRSVKGEHES